MVFLPGTVPKNEPRQTGIKCYVDGKQKRLVLHPNLPSYRSVQNVVGDMANNAARFTISLDGLYSSVVVM